MHQSTRRRPGERLFGLLVLIASLWLFWQAYSIAQFSSLSSSGALPLAATAIMVVSACLVLSHTMRLPLTPNVRFVRHVFPPIVGIVVALIFMFAIMLEPVGFLLSATVFLFLSMTFLHRKGWVVSLVMTWASLVLVYCVFRLIFKVILPEGIIPERELMAAVSHWFNAFF
ncbi:tripartite tricarboxylate transporter TctB family protein [Marinomonas sp. IMCC 4694]|uniref:tripartite tricarboxylate transporter TctB family protein n=1 Tax=Marinomonas sp. IMCC 4694 TaxID=2605432 RepID=UPI0011E80204|nr:tripartite tricarboxylate transporter TctB family protein [Marinomonas sp. IMCC 4694]TYL48841.1 tripartite tricarboxylate transporter TctB family protein [Marinomonas sp. IMCC 4694]